MQGLAVFWKDGACELPVEMVKEIRSFLYPTPSGLAMNHLIKAHKDGLLRLAWPASLKEQDVSTLYDNWHLFSPDANKGYRWYSPCYLLNFLIRQLGYETIQLTDANDSTPPPE